MIGDPTAPMSRGPNLTEVTMASNGSGIDRRKFLKLGAATSGLAIGGCGRVDEVMADVIHGGVGGITESDVTLALASNAAA